MTNELIERYIYSVKKRLPKKMRNDVAKELEELISDMLDERCGEFAPTDKDIRVVLTEIGTPDELALKYNPENENYFLREPYYSRYIITSKIVMLAVLCILIPIAGTIIVHDSRMHIPELILLVIMVILAVLASFGIVTLVFWFYNKKIASYYQSHPIPKKNKTPEQIANIIKNLPPVPKKSSVKIIIESILGIILWTIFGTVMLFVGFRKVSFGYFNYPLPIFNTDEFVQGSYWIVIIAVLGIVRDSVRLHHKEYNFTVLFSSVITNTALILSAVIWLSNYHIFNFYLDKAEISYFIYSNMSHSILDGCITLFCQNFLSIFVLIVAVDMMETVYRSHKRNFSSPASRKQLFFLPHFRKS